MSGLRSGGRVPVSQPQRRIYPSLDPSPSLPPPRAGHTCWSTPAAMPSAEGPLSFIPLLCPQNTSNSLHQCPAWRKSGLCIRWHSVRCHSMAPDAQSPHPTASGDVACVPALLLPVSSALRALEPRYFMPSPCHLLSHALSSLGPACWAGRCLYRKKQNHMSSVSYTKAAGSLQRARATYMFTVSLTSSLPHRQTG